MSALLFVVSGHSSSTFCPQKPSCFVTSMSPSTRVWQASRNPLSGSWGGKDRRRRSLATGGHAVTVHRVGQAVVWARATLEEGVAEYLAALALDFLFVEPYRRHGAVYEVCHPMSCPSQVFKSVPSLALWPTVEARG